MKHLIYLLVLPLFAACVDIDTYDNNAAGNVEALWQLTDRHYCFFQYKAEAYGLDWDEVHARYARQTDPKMTQQQLFEVMAAMLGELRDGHVNLYAPWDISRYWAWQEDWPSNVSDTLLARYLGTDYQMACGMKYRTLDDNIGYVRLTSFDNELGNGNLDYIFNQFAPCQALIIDIRDNGGGKLTEAERLAARFTNEELHVGYIAHKTGNGHNDFSEPKQQILKPSSAMRWQKPVAVLTNRAVYSAANEFVKYMKCCPRVIVVGDRTGGGSGMPFNDELPNGWAVRFSACPMWDKDMHDTEFGIEPDIRADITDADFRRGRDTIIEAARAALKQ